MEKKTTNDKKEKEITLKDSAKIVVVGIGGGGGNAVNHMFKSGVKGADLFIANTDQQILNMSPINKTNKIAMGPKLTSGLGAGGNPEVGVKAAIESKKELREAVKGADMVFLTAGMGGGSGTGAISEVAKISKEEGALTIAVVTEPFMFEGKKRRQVAENGLETLNQCVDSLILVSNDNLLQIVGRRPIGEAFAACDDVLKTCVKSVTELITVPALVNLDFADVRSVLLERGRAFFGIGMASGKDDVAIKAAQEAVQSPLLKHQLSGAKSAIVSINGGPNMTLFDSEDIINVIEEAAKTPLEIIYGVNIDPALEDSIIVTLIATGFDDEQMEYEEPVVTKRTATQEPKAVVQPQINVDLASVVKPVQAKEPEILTSPHMAPQQPVNQFHPETYEAAQVASRMIQEREYGQQSNEYGPYKGYDYSKNNGQRSTYQERPEREEPAKKPNFFRKNLGESFWNI